MMHGLQINCYRLRWKEGISHDKIRLVENQKRIVYSKQIHKGKLGANLRFNQYLAKPNIMNYSI